MKNSARIYATWILFEGIQIFAKGAREQHRLLGEDRDSRPKVMQAHSLDVYAIDENGPLGKVHYAEQS